MSSDTGSPRSVDATPDDASRPPPASASPGRSEGRASHALPLPDDRHRRSHRATGPHLGALAIVCLAITVIGIGGSAAAAGVVFPTVSLASTASAIATAYPGAVAWLAFCTFGSAVPLGIYAATAYTRLRQLRVAVPGPSIGWFGGSVAAISLMVTAAVLWVAALPEVAVTPPVALALAAVGFLVGGVAFTTGLGLLIAGIAVPGLVIGILPRWLAWVGLVLAAFGELSFVVMLWPPFSVVLPVVRFVGLAWLIAAGFILTRATVHDRTAATRPLF